MGAQLPGGGVGKYEVEQNSEINVTPFVDIMLVLLIIFMVAAPLAAPSVEVKLPRAVAPLAANPPVPIYISIQSNGQAFLGDFPVALDQIGPELQGQIGRRNPADERIFIRADESTRYGDFMQVMNSLQDNGFYSVALVGEDTDVQ